MADTSGPWVERGSPRILGIAFGVVALIVGAIRLLAGESCVGACGTLLVGLLVALGAGALALIVAAAFFLS